MLLKGLGLDELHDLAYDGLRPREKLWLTRLAWAIALPITHASVTMANPARPATMCS